MVFAITQFKQYLLGRPFEVFNDRNRIISIVRKPFGEVLPGFQRWLVALMLFPFSITHIPGCHLVCTNDLSRTPLSEKTQTPEETRSMREYVGMVMEEAPINAKAFSKHPQHTSLSVV